ncbi:MAG: DUF4430 domain-containing protein [Prevotella sp.]|nr:DUF4430 domain-containing protein [Staphylococcus sp.]MCM1351030.1 DUF4430 domain-containing protein [Prevotella sp.]
MNQKRISIIASVLAVLVIVFVCLWFGTKGAQKAGQMHLYITGENGVVLFDQEVDFYQGDVLIDVLRRHVEIEEGKGSQKGMIIGINGDTTDITTHYYKLVVNCEFASVGAWELVPSNQDEIRITYSSIADWEVGC